MERERLGNHRISRVRALGAVAILMVSGCSFVPKSRVEEGQRIAQTLRSENVRLKDQTQILRTKNQDLIERAQDDARRLAIQGEALDRLEKSVTAYQGERDQLANAFESFKRQARSAAIDKVSAAGDWSDLPHPPDDPLDSFARRHPNWTFDPETKSLAIAADRLFDPGATALKPEAAAEIEALGEALAAVSKTWAEPLDLEIEAAGEMSDLHQAIFKTDLDPETEAAQRFSAASRAARVREALLGPAVLDPSSVRIAPPVAKEVSQAENDSRVILRLLPAGRSKGKAPAALDSTPNRDR